MHAVVVINKKEEEKFSYTSKGGGKGVFTQLKLCKPLFYLSQITKMISLTPWNLWNLKIKSLDV